MLISLPTLGEVATYHLLCQSILPRPIAWVLTADPSTGRRNLAPFSFFAPLASDPPLLGFSIGNRLGGREKDTAANAAVGAPVVVHIPARSQRAAVQASAAPLPRHVSELDAPDVDDELDEAWGFPLPRLASAPVAFGSRVTQRIDLVERADAQILVLAQVEVAWVRDAAVSTDQRGRTVIDPQVVDPLSRLGAGRFAGTEPL